MLGIQSVQSFKGTIMCPGMRKYPDTGLVKGDFKIDTDNIASIVNDFNHQQTVVTFKNKAPDLVVSQNVISTKEIVNAYAAAKNSDIVISL